MRIVWSLDVWLLPRRQRSWSRSVRGAGQVDQDDDGPSPVGLVVNSSPWWAASVMPKRVPLAVPPPSSMERILPPAGPVPLPARPARDSVAVLVGTDELTRRGGA